MFGTSRYSSKIGARETKHKCNAAPRGEREIEDRSARLQGNREVQVLCVAAEVGEETEYEHWQGVVNCITKGRRNNSKICSPRKPTSKKRKAQRNEILNIAASRKR
jgi:hypothetical protein